MNDGNYLSLLTRVVGTEWPDRDAQRVVVDWALQSVVTKILRARWG